MQVPPRQFDKSYARCLCEMHFAAKTCPRLLHFFLPEMTSEKEAQQFHSDDVSLLRLRWCFWLVEVDFPGGATNEKHHSDLVSNASLVWDFCARFSKVISQGNQWWRLKLSAVFSWYLMNTLVLMFLTGNSWENWNTCSCVLRSQAGSLRQCQWPVALWTRLMK